MNTNDIVFSIDAEISRLQQAKDILADTSSPANLKRKPERLAVKSTSGNASGFVKTRKRREMSAAGRERIAAAQRARWAKLKKGASAKKAARPKLEAPAPSASKT